MDQNELASLYLKLSPVLFRMVRHKIPNKTIFFDLLEAAELIMGSTSYIKNNHVPDDVSTRTILIQTYLQDLAQLRDETPSDIVRIYVSQLELIGRFVLACWDQKFQRRGDE